MATTYVGGSIGYSSGNINDLSLDMQALKPTHFYCSSKLLLKFYKKIQASISKKNRIMLRAVKWALSSKSESLKTSSSVDNRMYDRTVLKPLKRSVLGTGMKHIIVGGDYISQEILDFIRISCSTKIWEAYTHKQAAGIISLASADDIIKDHVGGVLEHLEMKLEYVERKDCPEFTCDEDPPTIGRIFIKGPGVVKNYLGSTAKLEENEYWIDTGDVAYVSSAGAIRLLSNQRSKIVLANGEIVDPIRLESLYSELEMIQDVKIQPDTGNSYLKALVYPNKYYNPKKNEIEEDKEIATGIEPNAKDEEEEKEPIEDKEDESEEIYFEATKDDIVIDKDSVKVEDVMSAFKEVVRKHKLPPYEEISDVTMAYEEFGIKNGLLSTSLKIVR